MGILYLLDPIYTKVVFFAYPSYPVMKGVLEQNQWLVFFLEGSFVHLFFLLLKKHFFLSSPKMSWMLITNLNEMQKLKW